MALLAPSSCQLQAVYGSGSWTNKITKKTYTVPYNWSKNNLFCMRDTGKQEGTLAVKWGVCFLPFTEGWHTSVTGCDCTDVVVMGHVAQQPTY